VRSLTATEAARRFSAVLDAIERRGESFVVVRRGKAVATIQPAAAAGGRAVKDILRAHAPDRAWASELRELRAALGVEHRRWND
jgi:antitoxin (DNA-binding transcriptional repressor) of toxin-antitoxin stability system